MMPATEHTLTLLAQQAIDQGQTDTALEYGRQLDELTKPRPPARIVDAALYYAALGLPVFPLQPRLKIPHGGTRGFKDASTDPKQIVAWWRKWPDSNLGLATGHLVDVIDIDGPAGVLSWARMENLPPILGTVSTPRPGGNHLYVQASREGNAAGIFPGVDIRGLGGYVVAPPSINADGLRYHWRKPLALPAAVSAEVAA